MGKSLFPSSDKGYQEPQGVKNDSYEGFGNHEWGFFTVCPAECIAITFMGLWGE